MTLDSSPTASLDSFVVAEEKFLKAEKRMIRDMDLGSSKGAHVLIQKHIENATQVVLAKMALESRRQYADFILTIQPLDPVVIALVALQGSLNSIANQHTLGQAYLSLGRTLENEVYAFSLQSQDKKLAARLEVLARQKNSSLKYRRQAIRAMAAKAGFKPGRWKPPIRAQAGQWLAEVVLEIEASPFMFVPADHKHGVSSPYLTITEEAVAYSQEMVRRLLNQHPVPLPLLSPPPAWKDLWLPVTINSGTYRIPLVRKTHCGITQSHLRRALEDGSMQPVLNSLNHMQDTAWRINPVMLEVLQWAYDFEVKIEGLPPTRDIVLGPRATPEAWEAMSVEEKKLYRVTRSKTIKKNRGHVGQRENYKSDVETAKLLIDAGNRFWTPCSMDYRGRVYPAPHFNYQRQDYVRAMFEFSEGKPLGPDGLYWLMAHLATTGDFDKMSKKPFEERVRWVSNNHAKILSVARNPTDDLWWIKGDSPFMFLAACMEYEWTIQSDNPSRHISHLPISFDGSCSGLQHFAAMTRCDVTAPLVNLVPSDAVSDIYQTVADKVIAKVTQHAQDPDAILKARVNKEDVEFSLADLAQKALDFGITRTLVKRNVMTWAYSSKKFGMGRQLMKDTMEPLAAEVTLGELDEHPFAIEGEEWDGQMSSRYLGATTYDCIEETVSRPAEAMKFLQGIARTMAHEGKPVIWNTPMGLPVVLHCPNQESKQIQLYLQDRGVRVRTTTLLVEDQPGIDKGKAANGIAPCFVHSYDACHLQMVVEEANQQGIHSFALVHDSFGCHAGDARKFRQVILDTFHKLYAHHDVLQSIYDEACTQLLSNHHRLPQMPLKGFYDIEEVLNAAYAFA